MRGGNRQSCWSSCSGLAWRGRTGRARMTSATAPPSSRPVARRPSRPPRGSSRRAVVLHRPDVRADSPLGTPGAGDRDSNPQDSPGRLLTDVGFVPGVGDTDVDAAAVVTAEDTGQRELV